jgi:hypothetical protein
MPPSSAMNKYLVPSSIISFARFVEYTSMQETEAFFGHQNQQKEHLHV